VDNYRFLCMHRHVLALSQVNALFWSRLACGIPSISTVYAQAWRRCAQVIHMLVHRQRGSSPLPGWQAAADRTGRRSLPTRPAPRAGVRDTLAHRPLLGRTLLPGSRRPDAGVKSRVGLRPRHRHDQGVSKPETTTRCRWLPNSMPLSVAVDILVSAGAEPRYLCDAGSIANRRLLKLNLARLVRQAGKRCYRRRPRRR
jgi:hypothetical protein